MAFTLAYDRRDSRALRRVPGGRNAVSSFSRSRPVGGFSRSRRQDAFGTGAFVRDLQLAEATVIKQTYRQYKAATGALVPIEITNAPWATSSRNTIIDGVGRFELAAEGTSNMPVVDVVSDSYEQGIYQFRSGYFLTAKEIAAWEHKGQPIPQQKIQVVHEAYQQTLHNLILKGHEGAGLPGLLNNPNWLRLAAPYKLDGSITNANNLLATLNAGATGMMAATDNQLSPNTLLLPFKQYNYLLSQSRLDPTLADTTLKQFRENNISVVNIDFLTELAGAGPNGEDVALFYSRDKNSFFARITSPFQFYPPMPVGGGTLYRAATFDYNGINVWRPGHCLRMIGV